MFDRAHVIWESIKDNAWGDNVEVTAKCFLCYDYPELHPLQGEDREELWGAQVSQKKFASKQYC